ncbi:MAG: PQQ-binding-like beta-propeller repeat protein [Acidimicrobiia bacterium]|nr:PQQ-binding-like beta-propeller repeat protein [Acidimicrobiia bacterium]
MKRWRQRVAVAVAAVLAVPLFSGTSRAAPPLPEPGFVHPLAPSPCTVDRGNTYEAAQYKQEGWAGPNYERYHGACQRLHFAFGPIHVRPGQNDVIIQPITIEKPAYDGYVTRLSPNLVRADGSVPPIEEIHLHHGVWYSLNGNYGNSAFFASGEEKTIFDLPRGYGMPVKATDTWQLLYMVHNQRSQPDNVWITYDVDYVAKDVAEKTVGLRPALPLWLDVRPSTYPVFNVQRKYGHKDPVTGHYVCTWPNEKTADFDPWGKTFTGQGAAGNGTGTPYRLPARGKPYAQVPNFQGGTIIGIGGHLHPGGLDVDVDLQRAAERRRIFTSEAHYWNWKTPTKEGGPPTSWDLSMSVTGLPRWGVHVEPGDTIWMSATYDAETQSTYEDMGIAVAWLAPDGSNGPTAPGLDPIKAPADTSEACTSGGLRAPTPTLCDKGTVTHGHMAEANHHGGPNGTLPMRIGSPASRVEIAAFSYQPGDSGSATLSPGIPTVPLGGSLTFDNWDAAADIYHSVTACAYPCTGATGIAFPLADGRSSTGKPIEFDSGELGYGPPGNIGPAKQQPTWTLNVTAANGFEPGATYTYFCRIHPFMRGAFAVTAPGAHAPGPSPPPGPTPGPAPPTAGGEWRSYGHDFANTRNQDDEHVIGRGNAARLAPAWTFSSQAAGGEGDFTGTPVVADGYVIAGSNRGWVFALNADSGQLVWKAKVPTGGINSTVAVDGGLVYAAVSAGGRPYVVALDEATGALRWRSAPIDTQAGSDVYSSPVLFDGVVTIGVSGGAAELGPETERNVFHGSVVFLDAATGALLKKTWTIPTDQWAAGFAGASVWSTPAIDPSARLAYVGTGNPFQPEHKSPRADAILKIDMDRSHASFGEIVGAYQGTVETYETAMQRAPCFDTPGNPPPYYPQGAGSCGDMDLDFGAAPNLFRGANGKQLVGEGQKAGVYHVVETATMKGQWQTVVGPPSSVGGIVGSTAYDGKAVYGPVTVPGYVWSIGTSSHQIRWASPTGDGAHYGEPVAVANGVMYTVDLKGFLDGYDTSTGVPLLHRPIALGANTGTNSTNSWGGVSVARHTVYAATGITSQANGFIVAFRPDATEHGGGGGGGGVPGLPGGPTIVAGPGAYVSTYLTPAMAVRVGQPLDFVNADLPQHDVVAVDLGPDGQPLFRSKLIGLGEVATVDGTNRLTPGKTYTFYCSIHPGMRGTLIATP